MKKDYNTVWDAITSAVETADFYELNHERHVFTGLNHAAIVYRDIERAIAVSPLQISLYTVHIEGLGSWGFLVRLIDILFALKEVYGSYWNKFNMEGYRLNTHEDLLSKDCFGLVRDSIPPEWHKDFAEQVRQHVVLIVPEKKEV